MNPGDAIACVETAVGRIGMAICFDLNFPEAAGTLQGGPSGHSLFQQHVSRRADAVDVGV